MGNLTEALVKLLHDGNFPDNWILAAAAIVIVVVVFSVWYFATARSTKIQPARPPTKTEAEWRRFYEQKIKPSPTPGQYLPPVKSAP